VVASLSHDGPYPRTPGTGNTGTRLCPRRIPESDKLGVVSHLHQLRLCLLWHRLLLYVCLDRVADFIFAYSVLSKLEYAFVCDVRLVLAKLGPHGAHLILDGSDCIDFGISIPL
jgi:hypothetical protein